MKETRYNQKKAGDKSPAVEFFYAVKAGVILIQAVVLPGQVS